MCSRHQDCPARSTSNTTLASIHQIYFRGGTKNHLGGCTRLEQDKGKDHLLCLLPSLPAAHHTNTTLHWKSINSRLLMNPNAINQSSQCEQSEGMNLRMELLAWLPLRANQVVTLHRKAANVTSRDEASTRRNTFQVVGFYVVKQRNRT